MLLIPALNASFIISVYHTFSFCLSLLLIFNLSQAKQSLQFSLFHFLSFIMIFPSRRVLLAQVAWCSVFLSPSCTPFASSPLSHYSLHFSSFLGLTKLWLPTFCVSNQNIFSSSLASSSSREASDHFKWNLIPNATNVTTVPQLWNQFHRGAARACKVALWRRSGGFSLVWPSTMTAALVAL